MFMSCSSSQLRVELGWQEQRQNKYEQNGDKKMQTELFLSSEVFLRWTLDMERGFVLYFGREKRLSFLM